MASPAEISAQDTMRRIHRIQTITITWMSIEAAISLTSAWKAQSSALLAFGGDSAIELLSALVVLWRFRVHVEPEAAEKRAARIAGVLLKPDATNVAGLRTWNWLGRFVKRGEKGIFILAPMVGKRSTKDVATDEPSEDATTEGQRTLYGFRAVYVFERLSRDLRPEPLRARCNPRMPL
jgi:hypothetical protein